MSSVQAAADRLGLVTRKPDPRLLELLRYVAAANDSLSPLQEGVKTENDHINLKVAGQDGSVVQFKIKRHTPLSKLMKAYCERQVFKFT